MTGAAASNDGEEEQARNQDSEFWLKHNCTKSENNFTQKK